MAVGDDRDGAETDLTRGDDRSVGRQAQRADLHLPGRQGKRPAQGQGSGVDQVTGIEAELVARLIAEAESAGLRQADVAGKGRDPGVTT